MSEPAAKPVCDLPSCRDADGCRQPNRGIVPLRRADDMPVRYMDARSPEERRRWFAWFDRWLARR